MQVGEDSAPNAGAIPQFFDKVSGRVQKMSFKAIHELRGKARCSDGRPFTIAVRLEKKPPGGQHVAFAARLKQVANPDGFGLCRGIALHVKEALPEFGREALTGRRYDEDIN